MNEKKQRIRRIFLIVLDGVGVGAAPDAADYGDEGANTLQSVAKSGALHIPNLIKLGIGRIDGLSFLQKTCTPLAATARLIESSKGKDTTTGHWEIAGLVSSQKMPTYPNGFPDEIVDALRAHTGRGVLCNLPYSGTQAIRDFGQAHLQTGDLIVYTSADSVLQIAAHTNEVPLETLYEYCAYARSILNGKHAVGRVIARPFCGTFPNFVRTKDRRDFSLAPPQNTLLDALCKAGLDVLGVGKISDIFARRGMSREFPDHGNADCMARTSLLQQENFHGLCFVNLVDFDMLYGHRNDIAGFADALNAFDDWLGAFLLRMREGDVLMITADHGCDPGFLSSTDHSREYVPFLCAGAHIAPVCLGTQQGFDSIAATIARLFGVSFSTNAEGFAAHMTKEAK